MPTTQLLSAVTRLTTMLVDVAGAVFTLIMVYGGIRFMIAHSPKSVQAAKELMTRAAIGLVLVLMVDAIRQLIQYVAA